MNKKPIISLKVLTISLLCVLLIGTLLSLVFLRIAANKKNGGLDTNNSNAETLQKPLSVLEVSPPDGAIEIYPGEIKVEFVFNQEVFSSNVFKVQISPAPSAGFEIINSFPSTKILTQTLGGLLPTTQYTVTISDSKGASIKTWSFTTSNQTPESSSAEVKKIQKQTINESYPLFDFVPYKTQEFSIDYSDRLTLEVKINGRKTPQIISQVQSWIQEHGIDPSIHTIIYRELNI